MTKMIATMRASFDPVFPNNMLKIQDSIGLIANMERKSGATTMLQSLYMPYSQVQPVRASEESCSHCAFQKWSEVGHQRRGGTHCHWEWWCHRRWRRRRRTHQGSMA